MSPDEVAGFLAAEHKVQLATNGPDGVPHLVTMYYTLVDGKIAFWTYRTSQKALNLARDPRIACLVETGHGYFDLRGVQVQGVVTVLEDQQDVRAIGRGITAAIGADLVALAGGALDDYVEQTARKRFGYLVQPRRIISWDHSKLLGQ
jgi:Pyridoxamine 5'-phosphate oxidase